MQFFIYLQKGHPSSHYTKTITNNNTDKKSDDIKYKSSKQNKSTKTSKASSITKLYNYQIRMKRSFTTLNIKI